MKSKIMKNLIPILLIAFVAFTACQPKNAQVTVNTGTYSDDLSLAVKDSVTKDIMELTTNWVNANINMDAGKAIELWDNSPDLMFAENGVFFLNRDSIYSYITGFYQSTTSMNAEWKQRVVVPLSLNAASMSGYFYFKATFKSGEIFEGTVMFTGVFVRKNNKWALIHGHESLKQNHLK